MAWAVASICSTQARWWIHSILRKINQRQILSFLFQKKNVPWFITNNLHLDSFGTIVVEFFSVVNHLCYPEHYHLRCLCPSFCWHLFHQNPLKNHLTSTSWKRKRSSFTAHHEALQKGMKRKWPQVVRGKGPKSWKKWLEFLVLQGTRDSQFMDFNKHQQQCLLRRAVLKGFSFQLSVWWRLFLSASSRW